MTRVLKRLFLFTFFIVSTNVYAQSPTNQLLNLLGNLHTMQAYFSQTITNTSGSVLQQSTGTMDLQRPGLFRWSTDNPIHQLAIADGTHLWFYDKDLQQITKQKQAASQSNSPGLLLSDSVNHLAQTFFVTKINSAEGQAFLLRPKQNSPLFSSVSLFFNHQQLEKMILQDHLEQTTTIIFSDVKTNIHLSTSLFTFNPPAGVSIVSS